MKVVFSLALDVFLTYGVGGHFSLAAAVVDDVLFTLCLFFSRKFVFQFAYYRFLFIVCSDRSAVGGGRLRCPISENLSSACMYNLILISSGIEG
jgi:hypothetical protein